MKLADEEDFKHKGQMSFVDNELDPNSGTIRAHAVFENKNLFLTPGLFGKLRLFGGQSQALLIPDAAIKSDQASKIVLSINDKNVVEAKVVTLGPLIDGLRVIRKGLKSNDRIIIAGQQRARTGQPVTPQDSEIKTEQKQ
ncbi:MAG: efflux RND transporter periplasmic adaptor subunit [Pseudomonadota bacterium]